MYLLALLNSKHYDRKKIDVKLFYTLQCNDSMLPIIIIFMTILQKTNNKCINNRFQKILRFLNSTCVKETTDQVINK